MLKNKYVHVTHIAILAALLSYSIVHACSPVEPLILIRCSNMQISIGPNTGPMEGESYKDRQERRVKETMSNLLAIAPECAEDLTPVLDSFEQELAVWLDYESRDAFLDGDLILEPYSLEKDAELGREKGNLLSCGYAEYKHIDNWVIISETSRPYCHIVPATCGTVVLSLGNFLFYLVTNISIATLPYLAGFFLAGATIIYGWWKILKNRSMLKLWKMIVLCLGLLAGELFLIVMPFWLPGQIIGWVSFFGILVLWYKYFQNTKYAAKQKAG